MRPSMRLSFPSFIQFSLHAHTCTHVSFFFAKFIYLEAKADEKSSNFSNTSLHERYVKFSKFSKFSLSFSPQIYRESKCIEIYIYIYVCIHSWSGDFKRTIGKVYLQQRASYEVLKDSDGKQVGCTVARLPYFSSTFVFSFIPCSPRFKRNFLQLSYTCRSTLFTSSFTLRVCMYIYIFNKFTQRSFNLISQPAAYRSEQFLQIKGKNPFSSLSLSLFSPPRRGKINRKMLRWNSTRMEGRGKRRRKEKKILHIANFTART